MAQILPIRFQEHIQVVIFMKMFENSKINEAGVNIIPTGNAPLTFRDFFNGDYDDDSNNNRLFP